MKSLYTTTVTPEDSVSGEVAVTDAVWMMHFTVLDSLHRWRMMRTASTEFLYCQQKVVSNLIQSISTTQL